MSTQTGISRSCGLTVQCAHYSGQISIGLEIPLFFVRVDRVVTNLGVSATAWASYSIFTMILRSSAARPFFFCYVCAFSSALPITSTTTAATITTGGGGGHTTNGFRGPM